MPSIEIIETDLSDPVHADALLKLLSDYASKLIVGGNGLSEQAKSNLISGLREHPTKLILLAWDDEKPVGFCVCMRGFSTFGGRGTMNVHDLAVAEKYQGCGIGTAIMSRVFAEATASNCCKVTLEVERSNAGARRLYERLGFCGNDEFADSTMFFLEHPL